MSTNILELPQLQAAFNLANNADWTDKIQFLQEDGVTPLQLTGITFRGQMRPEADSPVVALTIGTSDGTLQVDGPNGMLIWDVPASMFDGMEAGNYVFDLLAFGDGHTINLFQMAGAATVTMNEGVTKPSTEE